MPCLQLALPGSAQSIVGCTLEIQLFPSLTSAQGGHVCSLKARHHIPVSSCFCSGVSRGGLVSRSGEEKASMFLDLQGFQPSRGHWANAGWGWELGLSLTVRETPTPREARLASLYKGVGVGYEDGRTNASSFSHLLWCWGLR